MAGYWLGPTTPEEVLPLFFRQENIDGYKAFARRIGELEARNPENFQILLLFTGRAAKKAGSEEDSLNTRGWDPDCNLFESVLDFVSVKREPKGWLIKVGVGSPEEWKTETNPFRTDPRLKINTIPTLLAWNTMKRISGFQTFNVENILVMLED